jgi:hypothetical protein
MRHVASINRANRRLAIALLFLVNVAILGTAAAPPATTHDTRVIEGWTVHVSRRLLTEQSKDTDRALELLQRQLAEIVRVVPSNAVARLREAPLWFSPEYPGVKPTAEYHPDAGWLREHGRDPAMARAVEFTDIRHFEREMDRMPNFALHELAHAYHHRVLGHDHAGIQTAFRRAKESGRYDRVERRYGGGRSNTWERAYALSNPQEYFAEGTEAFFSRNDFFPFTRAQLEQHDPGLFAVLREVWGVTNLLTPTGGEGATNVALPEITAPPAALNVPSFHKKFISANGYPIVASERVSDYALREAAFLVNRLLAHRPDAREAMIRGGSRLCILAHNEFTTDLPEFANLKPKDWWDARARGTGGSETDPYCSCGEENLLGYPGDPYAAECILIHEFAHNIHLRGMVKADPGFDARVKAAYDDAMAKGLWKGKYAAVNHHEYFAEGAQSWFDNNRPPDHDHNHVDTRAELLDYDPALAALCREVFGDAVLRYTKPATRLHGHLAGYDPSQAPTFAWPERLQEVRKKIRREAEERSRAGGGNGK